MLIGKADAVGHQDAHIDENLERRGEWACPDVGTHTD